MHKSENACGVVRGCYAALPALLVLTASLVGSRQVAQAQDGAQPPRVHYRWSQEAVPGEIGSEQVRQGVVPAGYFQPVRVLGPEGLEVGVRSGDGGALTLRAPADFALLVGAVYRLRLGGIPDAVGAELYPSVELIDRLHPPQGVEGRHPILVHFTREDLELALTGRLVTKVIYLEQQEFALPVAREDGETPIYDATPEQDALEAADVFGRPVAIVRLGQWAPLDAAWSDDPLGPPPPVIFPIGGASAADEAALGRQAAARGEERGDARSAVARGEVRRAAVLFPPIARQGVGERKESASAVDQGWEARGESRRERGTGPRAVRRGERGVSDTLRGTVKRSGESSGEVGSWRRRGGS